MAEAFTWFFVFFHQEFRRGNLEAFQTLMGLSPAHFFGCYNPKQLAGFLGIPHQRLYEHLKAFSLYSLKAILLKFMVHQAVVDYFLNDIPDKAGGTNGLGVTINLAARQGWTDIVQKQIEADPLSVHQRGWIGDTPLHWPAHNGYVEIVALLLDAGADIEADEINCYGGKPLHWASEHGPATVGLLLKRGADVNARNVKADSDFYGFTPLIMNASQKDDCAEATEFLLEAGADIDAADARGKTALAHAVEGGLQRVPDVLRRHGATG